MTPTQGQGQCKQYKMIEFNGGYKHGRFEKIWLNSLCEMFNVKVFATEDGQTRLITYSYESKTDKKKSEMLMKFVLAW